MERTATCSSCRRGIFPGDAFCSWCGASALSAEVDAEGQRAQVTLTVPTADRLGCGSCNAPMLPGDVYCATCGARQGTEPTAGFGQSWSEIPHRVCEASGDKYEFVRELGRGGMGIVFVARDRELHRLVAIKVLSPAWLTDESMIERFRREARTIASLRHEAIVTVYNEGRAGNLSYFVMDYIDGVSLSKVLRSHGPLPIPMVEAILYRVGAALSYAHRPTRGVIHRDIKPSNIMVDSEGHTFVMDFGISKVAERPSGLTSTGLVMGTPEYMSPEQCRGHTVTPRSDQYSFGAVLYAMLTGAPPFTGPFYQVLMAHQTEAIPSLVEKRPDCPPELAAVVEKMLAKVPDERWDSILAAGKELGLRPLAHDDPVVVELGELVRRISDAPSGDGAEDEDDHRTPTSIRILPHPDELEVGDEVALTATVVFPDGIEETGQQVAWQTTDPAIARVDPDTGQLVAVGVGSALIKAAGLGLEHSIAVEVGPARAVRVAIEPENVEVRAGETLRLRANALDKRGNPVEADISWSSSDPRTASVAADGTLTAHRDGTVSVLAHGAGVGGSTTVRVEPASATDTSAAGDVVSVARHIRTSQPPSNVTVGQSFRLQANALDDHGTEVDRPVSWEVEDPRLLEHLGNGRFRALGAGEGSVIAKSDEARTRVRVAVVAGAPAPPPAESRPAADEIQAGAGAETPVPGFLERLPVPAWAIAAAVVVLGGGTWLLTRGPGPEPAVSVASVRILAADGTPAPDELALQVGDSVTLRAAALGPSGDPLSDRDVQLESTDPTLASFDPATGLLVALATGTGRLVARSEGVSREIVVSIAVDVADVVVTRSNGNEVRGPIDLRVGGSTTLSARAVDRNGSELQGEPVEWESLSPDIVRVDDGSIDAIAAGSGRVRVSSGGASADISVQVAAAVQAPPPVEVRIVVEPSWAVFYLDGTRRSDGRATEITLQLRPGTYELRLDDNPLYQSQTTTFTVEPGPPRTIRRQLIRRDP